MRAPVSTRAGRAVLVRDPDGYLVEVSEATAAETARAAAPGAIVGTSIGLTVADTPRSLELYRDLLGFDVRETRQADGAELALNGLAAGRLEQTVTMIPGTAVAVILSDFTLPEGVTANPFRWRIQDVGSPQFQLEVRGLDALIERTKAAGYRFLSVDARPIQRPFGRFVFAIGRRQHPRRIRRAGRGALGSPRAPASASRPRKTTSRDVEKRFLTDSSRLEQGQWVQVAWRRLAPFVAHSAAEGDHGDPHQNGHDGSAACRPRSARSLAPIVDAPPRREVESERVQAAGGHRADLGEKHGARGVAIGGRNEQQHPADRQQRERRDRDP